MEYNISSLTEKAEMQQYSEHLFLFLAEPLPETKIEDTPLEDTQVDDIEDAPLETENDETAAGKKKVVN